MNGNVSQCVFRNLGLQGYTSVWQAMQQFTISRHDQSLDELWFVEHPSVFTQGQAGKQEHLLSPGEIPVVQVDRGGQVTYHGPGQQVVYFMIDLKRKKIGVRQLVTFIENIVIELLAEFKITASARADAPGVYVGQKKICSLGLKIKRGCSFHGLALNVNMDIEPFTRINPCGYQGLQIAQMADYCQSISLVQIQEKLKKIILAHLQYSSVKESSGLESELSQ